MAEAANKGITQAMRLFEVFDGSDIEKFKDWCSKLRVLLSLHAPEILALANGRRPPTDDATNAAKQVWITAQTQLFSLL